METLQLAASCVNLFSVFAIERSVSHDVERLRMQVLRDVADTPHAMFFHNLSPAAVTETAIRTLTRRGRPMAAGLNAAEARRGPPTTAA